MEDARRGVVGVEGAGLSSGLGLGANFAERGAAARPSTLASWSGRGTTGMEWRFEYE
jgi:hypothetical protein